jgi:serine/threonine protein phosphatase PrpC
VCAHLELPGLGDDDDPAHSNSSALFTELAARRAAAALDEPPPPPQARRGEHPVEAALRRSVAKLDADVGGVWRWRGVGSTLCAVCVVNAAPARDDFPTAPPPPPQLCRHRSGGGDGEFALGGGGSGRSVPEAPLPPPPRFAITANLGDSRAVLCRAGRAVDLTEDHKPDLPAEKARIEALGGRVAWHGLWSDPSDAGADAADSAPATAASSATAWAAAAAARPRSLAERVPLAGTGVWRVNGNLAVSRALGDAAAKPWVSGVPEVKAHALDAAEDEFIVVASDGLWDVMSSDEAVAFVRGALGSDPAAAGSSDGGGTAAATGARHRRSSSAFSGDGEFALGDCPSPARSSPAASPAAAFAAAGSNPLASMPPLSAAEVQQRKRQMARCLTEEVRGHFSPLFSFKAAAETSPG